MSAFSIQCIAVNHKRACREKQTTAVLRSVVKPLWLWWLIFSINAFYYLADSTSWGCLSFLYVELHNWKSYTAPGKVPRLACVCHCVICTEKNQWDLYGATHSIHFQFHPVPGFYWTLQVLKDIFFLLSFPFVSPETKHSNRGGRSISSSDWKMANTFP